MPRCAAGLLARSSSNGWCIGKKSRGKRYLCLLLSSRSIEVDKTTGFFDSCRNVAHTDRGQKLEKAFLDRKRADPRLFASAHLLAGGVDLSGDFEIPSTIAILGTRKL
jgi:hypothetical protein